MTEAKYCTSIGTQNENHSSMAAAAGGGWGARGLEDFGGEEMLQRLLRDEAVMRGGHPDSRRGHALLRDVDVRPVQFAYL